LQLRRQCFVASACVGFSSGLPKLQVGQTSKPHQFVNVASKPFELVQAANVGFNKRLSLFGDRGLRGPCQLLPDRFFQEFRQGAILATFRKGLDAMDDLVFGDFPSLWKSSSVMFDQK
jgi:hypothetical protein